MNNKSLVESKEAKNKSKEILLELALFINKKIYDENEITYTIYKATEKNLLDKLK